MRISTDPISHTQNSESYADSQTLLDRPGHEIRIPQSAFRIPQSENPQSEIPVAPYNAGTNAYGNGWSVDNPKFCIRIPAVDRFAYQVAVDGLKTAVSNLSSPS